MDNYLKKMDLSNIQKGKLYHIEVAHDDWCNLLKGKGECNCNPEYITKELEKRSIKNGE